VPIRGVFQLCFSKSGAMIYLRIGSSKIVLLDRYDKNWTEVFVGD